MIAKMVHEIRLRRAEMRALEADVHRLAVLHRLGLQFEVISEHFADFIERHVRVSLLHEISGLRMRLPVVEGVDVVDGLFGIDGLEVAFVAAEVARRFMSV